MLNPVSHRMLYSCTHTATVGVKGLRRKVGQLNSNLLSADKLWVNDLAVKQTRAFRCRQNKPQNEQHLEDIVERKPT